MASSSPSIPATHSEYRRTGKDGVDAGLELRTNVPVPKPKRGQILVRIRAVSLNYRDLAILTGKYPMAFAPQGIPCSDGAGEVVALGEDVSSVKVGDRVAGIFTPSFQGGSMRHATRLTGSLGGDIDGVLAQYVVLEAHGIVHIPDALSFEEAATLPCAGVTAYNALHAGASPLRAGHVVLVQGTGGVSVLAAQIALAAGARVIATSSSDDKLARMHKLGVAKEDLINYKTTPKWGDKAKELTGGHGVDHVIEVGGPGTIEQSVACTRLGGEVSVIGFVAGFAGSLNPLAILGGGLNVRGVLVGPKELFLDLNDAVRQGHIKPAVGQTFPFEKAVDAIKLMESAQHFGKIVIQV